MTEKEFIIKRVKELNEEFYDIAPLGVSLEPYEYRTNGFMGKVLFLGCLVYDTEDSCIDNPSCEKCFDPVCDTCENNHELIGIYIDAETIPIIAAIKEWDDLRHA